MDPSRVLFVGIGTSAVCYYRIMLPAMAMGADWVGLQGEPPNLAVATGLVEKDTKLPSFLGGKYDVVVLQQVTGEPWLELIKRMQDKGIKVIYEIDDYLHGIRHTPDHPGADYYTEAKCAEVEEAMKACDALIASTKWLKIKYGRFNEKAFVCRNGVDLKRYELGGKPERESINIGWAGAQGHVEAMIPWLQQVSAIMAENEKVNFVSVGTPFANGFKEHFPDERALAVPWAAIEQYPAAMTLFDIALAPAGRSRFYRGKSDLRWVEAGALSIPIVADPTVYPDIVHGETGFHARNAEQVRDALEMLIEHQVLRDQVGRKARAYVEENRTHTHTVGDWERAFDRILAA